MPPYQAYLPSVLSMKGELQPGFSTMLPTKPFKGKKDVSGHDSARTLKFWWRSSLALAVVYFKHA